MIEDTPRPHLMSRQWVNLFHSLAIQLMQLIHPSKPREGVQVAGQSDRELAHQLGGQMPLLIRVVNQGNPSMEGLISTY